MGVIFFNGISSDEIGIVVETPPDYEIAQRDYETVSVPGRSGDLIIDKGGYLNVDRTYQIAIGEENGNFAVLASKMAEWLNSGYGYKRLEDTYEPDFYMMATMMDPGSIVNILQQAGRTTVTFNRKPQRFYKYGEFPVVFESNGELVNPSSFESEPIITVYGSGPGQIQIGNYAVYINAIGGEMVINSEIQEVYHGNINKNNQVTFMDSFPKLVKGSNQIGFSGGVTKISVIPRWWTI